MNTESLYQNYLQHPIICTDTRNIIQGCLFFALKGDNFDGNLFAEKALEAGAAFTVIDAPGVKKDERYILVDDVLTALQDLARHHRSQFSIPFIAITGSNGKTTTKELMNSVLSQHCRTHATTGNLNNHIGVPLTLLSIPANTDIAIIEMGANHQKEIEMLCTIAKPTHGLITNVGKAHLEGFGGFEGVKIAKGELYEYLAKTNGIAFINSDNRFLVDMARDRGLQRLIEYGNGASNFVSGSLQASSPFLEIAWHRESMELDDSTHIVQSHLTGSYNTENILAAICVGAFFKLSTEQINQGITSYNPSNNRSQINKTVSNTLICDYYNANPSSMSVALDNLAMVQAENKVLILGDMFELGEEAGQEHQQIINKAENVPAGIRIFIGEEFFALNNHTDRFYRNTSEAYEALKAEPIKNSTVLIKGSRGMKLETLVELF